MELTKNIRLSDEIFMFFYLMEALQRYESACGAYARQALPRTSAGRGASETRLCAAPTRGNHFLMVPPPETLQKKLLLKQSP
jgi:hypothetical protein